MAADSSPPPSSGLQRVLAAGAVLATAVAFWPVTRWVMAESLAREQIRQSLLLLAMAAAALIWQHRQALRWHLDVGWRALALFAGAFVCVLLARWTGFSLVVLPGFVFALAASLQVAFGEPSFRLLKPLVIGFAVFLGTILLFPWLDWPLRGAAGFEAARLLHLLGLTPQLGLVEGPPAKLILSVRQQLFEVATECNGFGLMTSGILLSLMVGYMTGRTGRSFLWLVPAAVALGFIFNILRILAICLLAPRFPNHYWTLHETIGTLVWWIALGLIGWLAWRPERPAAASAAA